MNNQKKFGLLSFIDALTVICVFVPLLVKYFDLDMSNEAAIEAFILASTITVVKSTGSAIKALFIEETKIKILNIGNVIVLITALAFLVSMMVFKGAGAVRAAMYCQAFVNLKEVINLTYHIVGLIKALHK